MKIEKTASGTTLSFPATDEQAIEVLNRHIQERDNRIKELEKEKDEFAIAYLEWFENGGYSEDQLRTGEQLLEEYKKTQTK